MVFSIPLSSTGVTLVKIGFVLQDSVLIEALSVAENITLPFFYARSRAKNWRERCDRIASSLGIESILQKRPLGCFGGEESRAVFARAIILSPPLVLADEPTASLDVEN
ncbi:ATP-binding cassette domain-containing protein [Gleimia hominis]|uniref:ATP-binding cassette domain-containing protein n=1 Tax=Gleimia hominis TaxID=595468 RepID=UPI0035E4199F